MATVHDIYTKAVAGGVLSPKVTEERFSQMLQNDKERKDFFDYAQKKKPNFYSSDYNVFTQNALSLFSDPSTPQATNLENETKTTAGNEQGNAQGTFTNPKVKDFPAPTTEAEYQENLRRQEAAQDIAPDLQNINIVQEQPTKQPNAWQTFWKGLGAGAIRTANGLLGFLNRANSGQIAYNPMAIQQMAKQGMSPEEIARVTDDTKARLDKGNAEFYDKLNQKANQLSAESKPDGGTKSFTDYISEGKIGKALQLGLGTATESLPYTAAALNPVATAAMIMSMTEQNYNQSLEDNPDMSEGKRVASAVGNAAIEMAIERIGNPFKIFKAGKLTAPTATQWIKQVIKESKDNIYKGILRVLGHGAKEAGKEGLEEVATTASQDIYNTLLDWKDTDGLGLRSQWERAKKDNPEITAMQFAWDKADGLTNDFIGGALSGMMMSAPTTGVGVVREAKYYSKNGMSNESRTRAQQQLAVLQQLSDEFNVSQEEVAQAIVDFQAGRQLTPEQQSLISRGEEILSTFQNAEGNGDVTQDNEVSQQPITPEPQEPITPTGSTEGEELIAQLREHYEEDKQEYPNLYGNLSFESYLELNRNKFLKWEEQDPGLWAEDAQRYQAALDYLQNPPTAPTPTAQLKDQITSQATTFATERTHSDGNIYRVSDPADPQRQGYLVGSTAPVIDTTDPQHPIITNNELVTVIWDDNTRTQTAAKDLNLAAAPQTQADFIAATVEQQMNEHTADRLQQGEQPIMLTKGSIEDIQGFMPTADPNILEDPDTGNTYTLADLEAQGYQVADISDPQNIQIFPLSELRTAVEQQTKQEPITPTTSEQPEISEQPTANDTEGAPVAQAEVQEPIVPDPQTMSAQDLTASTMEFFGGDKVASTEWLDLQLKDAKRALEQARKQKPRSTDAVGFRNEYQQIQALQRAAQEQVSKLEKAKFDVATYKTQAEREAEAKKHAEMMRIRDERRKTEAGKQENQAPQEKYNYSPKFYGHEITITTPNGQELRARYVLHGVEALTPSHNPFDNFNPSEGYPQREDGQSVNDRNYKDPEEQEKVNQIGNGADGRLWTNMPIQQGGLIASHNGSFQGLMIAYTNGKAEKYKQSVIRNLLTTGIDASHLQEVGEYPVVSLELVEPFEFSTSNLSMFNAQETQRQSNTSAAAKYSRALTPQAISEIIRATQQYATLDAFLNDNKATNALVNALIGEGVLSQRDRAALFNGDALSGAGKDTMKQILLGTVLDAETIRLLGDEQQLLSSVLRAIPQIIDNKSLEEYALTEDINNAIRALYDMRTKGLTFAQYTRQLDITGKTAAADYKPFALLLAQEMQEGGVNAFRNVLTSYNANAKLAQGGQFDMFTGKPHTITSLKNQILQEYNYAELEQEPTESAVEQPTTEQPDPDEPATPVVAVSRPTDSEVQPTDASPQAGNGQQVTELQTAFAPHYLPIFDNLKKQYPEQLVLLRYGDTYETYDQDAQFVAQTAGVTLNQQGNVPMVSFPVDALNDHLQKFIAAGKRVAICDQVEDPRELKNLVKRGVKELVTGDETTEQPKEQVFDAVALRKNAADLRESIDKALDTLLDSNIIDVAAIDVENIGESRAHDYLQKFRYPNKYSEVVDKLQDDLHWHYLYLAMADEEEGKPTDWYDEIKEYYPVSFGIDNPSKGILRELQARQEQQFVAAHDKANGTELGDFLNSLGKPLPQEQAHKHFRIAKTGEVLNQYGIVGDITIGQKATNANRHTNNNWHQLSRHNWIDVVKQINTPLAITRYHDKENSYRIYLNAQINGKNICVGVDVNQVGREVFVSDIVTAYGRNISSIIDSNSETLLYPAEDKLKQMFEQFSSAPSSQGYAQPSVSDRKSTTNSANTQEISEKNAGNTPLVPFTKDEALDFFRKNIGNTFVKMGAKGWQDDSTITIAIAEVQNDDRIKVIRVGGGESKTYTPTVFTLIEVLNDGFVEGTPQNIAASRPPQAPTTRTPLKKAHAVLEQKAIDHLVEVARRTKGLMATLHSGDQERILKSTHNFIAEQIAHEINEAERKGDTSAVSTWRRLLDEFKVLSGNSESGQGRIIAQFWKGITQDDTLQFMQDNAKGVEQEAKQQEQPLPTTKPVQVPQDKKAAIEWFNNHIGETYIDRYGNTFVIKGYDDDVNRVMLDFKGVNAPEVTQKAMPPERMAGILTNREARLVKRQEQKAQVQTFTDKLGETAKLEDKAFETKDPQLAEQALAQYEELLKERPDNGVVASKIENLKGLIPYYKEEQAKRQKEQPNQEQQTENKNRVFTDEAYERAKARMKARLGRLNMGLDPEMLADQMVIAGYHIERGIRKFADFARTLLKEFGNGIRPYLKAMYNNMRDLPEGEPYRKEMDDYNTVMSFDIDNLRVEEKEILPTENKSVSLQTETADNPNRVIRHVGEVVKSKHTKTGEDLWVVVPKEHVDKEEYQQLVKSAKANNGYYSKFSKPRGFIFKSEQDANNFNNIEDERTDDQTAANTIAAQNQAEADISQAESIAVAPRTGESDGVPSLPQRGTSEFNRRVEEHNTAITNLDNSLQKVNDQLALLGYYAADTNDPRKFHEAYGYMRTAEAKALKDADRLAKQLAEDLGIEISKRKKLATANIAPAGGNVYFSLPLPNGNELYFTIDLMPNGSWLPYHRADISEDSLLATHIMWRIEAPKGSNVRYLTSNFNDGHFNDQNILDKTYADLLKDIRTRAKQYLPEIVSPTATRSEIIQQAVERQRKRKANPASIPTNEPMLDLFADITPEEPQQDPVGELVDMYNQDMDEWGRPDRKVEHKPQAGQIIIGRPNLPTNTQDNGNTEVRNDGQRESSPTQGEPTRQPLHPNGALGESQQPTTQRPNTRKVGGSNQQHRLHDGERSVGTPLQPTQQLTESNQPHLADDIDPSQWRNLNNFHARSGERLAPAAPRARYEANIAAIRLLKELQEQDRPATREEKEILSQYSGWGGLGEFFKGEPGTTYYSQHGEQSPYQTIKELLTDEELEQAQLSRNSAYYTPEPIIEQMWRIAERLGIRGGNILEGSAGIGNILALMPSDISHRARLQAVEIDPITSGILAQLYPDAEVHRMGFQETDIPNGSQDLCITNVPFVTGLRVYDKKHRDLSKRFGNIHDFCIAKNIRLLKDGGIGIFITSKGTLDNSKDLRRWMNQDGNADVIGAFRLHKDTFGGAGVTSDIIIVRKRVNGQKDPRAIDVIDTKVERTATLDAGEHWDKKKGQYVEDKKDVKLDYNRYFVEHPENMGGVMGFGLEHGDTRFGGTTSGCYPDPTIDQAQRLNDWVESLQQTAAVEPSAYTPSYRELERGATAPRGTYEQVNDPNIRFGSLLVNSKGQICKNFHGEAVPIDTPNTKVKGHTKAEVVKDYNALRDALNQLLDYQNKNAIDAELNKHLQALNRAYDNFVRKYGYLNRNTGLSWLRQDIDYPSIAALENVKETETPSGKKTLTVTKGDVFQKRVIGVQTEQKAENATDGVILSVQQFGDIRPDKIAEWLGKPTAEVEKEIIESRLGFRDPQSGKMVVSHEYLSGNVREKLEYAQEHNENGEYDTNIEELQKVIPVDIPAHLIEFNLGSTWIPSVLYQDYMREKFDISAIKLNHIGSAWVSDEKSWSSAAHNEKNRQAGVYSEKVGKQVYGHELMIAAMNNVPITVSKVEKHYDGTTETITDKVASQACADKIGQMKEDFIEWARQRMQQDQDLAEQIQKRYNDQFNAIVPMLRIDKRFLSEHLPNQNPKYTLYPHQQQAVVRGTMHPTMLAHEVGTGKTISLISTAMEMRRMGAAKKPMIVVQNATTMQFVKEAKDLYPNAKVLTVNEQDRTAAGRQEFYAKIKYNDWDLIIIPQSVFDMIPDSESRMRDFIQEKIDEKMHAIEAARQAGLDDKAIKQLERDLESLQDDLETNNMSGKKSKKKDPDGKKAAEQRATAEARAQEMLDRKTDDVEDFDDMGIDALFIDEAHNYKHLGFATMMTRGVKGIDPSYSKRAAALYLKCQSIYDRMGHKNVVFATGTPISNTAAEIWTFMKYLMPKTMMQENDIYYFDDFVHNFGKITQSLEFATNGKFKENTRFASYGNIPELQRLWLTVADCVLTREAEQAGGGKLSDKVPEIEGGKAQDIFLPQSPSLIDIMAAVRSTLEDYENMSGKEKKENSHIPLTMYGIAKRAAIDPRLVDASAPDEPLSKTNRAVEETLRSLEETKSYKGTVAIFCDNFRRLNAETKKEEFNIFREIQRKLIEQGVPASKIAIIESGMTDQRKQKIFDAVREGDIRVIMGSTQTLGTGVNIQTRLHTLIHMDAPDRPMDYTQRNGRIVRQGNLHKEWDKKVRILRFGVEDSLDVTSYQRLKTKAAFIDSIMEGKNTIDNNLENRVLEESEEGLFDNPVAVLSGSQYALLKSQAERELRKWETRQQQHNIDQIVTADRLKRNAFFKREAEQTISRNENLLQMLNTTFPNGQVREYNLNGTICRTADEVKAAIKDINKEVAERVEKLKKDVYGDKDHIALDLQFNGVSVGVDIMLQRNTRYKGSDRIIEVAKRVLYHSDALGQDTGIDSPTKDLSRLVDYIVGDMLSGKEARENIQGAKARIERMEKENAMMQQRIGKPFEHTAELEDARKKVEEYTALMKEELAAKEAKYAQLTSGKKVELTDQEDDDTTDTDEPMHAISEGYEVEADDLSEPYTPSAPLENETRGEYVSRIAAEKKAYEQQQKYERMLKEADTAQMRIYIMQDYINHIKSDHITADIVRTDEDIRDFCKYILKTKSEETIERIVNDMHESTAVCFPSGDIMIYAPAIPSIEMLRSAFVHEMQHRINKKAVSLQAEIVNNSNPQELADYIENISGSDFYTNEYLNVKKSEAAKGFRELADEFTAWAIEVCYDTPEGESVEDALRSYGIENDKLINTIINEYERQRKENPHFVEFRTRRRGNSALLGNGKQGSVGQNERTDEGRAGEVAGEHGSVDKGGEKTGRREYSRLDLAILRSSAVELINKRLTATATLYPNYATGSYNPSMPTPTTRSEVITQALVNGAKDNYQLLQAAIQKVSKDLKGIHAAMRMQADFDRNTVAALLNLTQTLAQSPTWGQYMPNTTAQIANQIRKAIGKEDISAEVNKIMDYVVDAQTQAAKEQWRKLLSTKIDKLNISGVASQGKVAIQGQHALRALNDALYSHLTSEQLDEQIADLQYQAANTTDESLKRQYEGKAIGYMMAQQYNDRVEVLQQDRQQLRDELDANRANKALKPQARQEQENAIKEAMRENYLKQAEAYMQCVRDLQAYINEQHAAAKDFLEKQNQNREKIRDYAAKDLAGTATNPNRLTTRRGVVRQVLDAFTSPIRDLQSLLRMCGLHAPDGEGYLYNHFMRRWTDAADEERQGIVAAQKTLDDKVAELTGGKYKTWEKVANDIKSKSRKMFSIEMFNGVDGENIPVTEEVPLDATNALYIYAVNKMMDGKMKLRAMNITEDDVAALTDQVRQKFGQEIIDIADWIQSEYFVKLRNRYNPTHEALFGAPMDAIDNYFPLRINPNVRQKNEDLGDADTDAARLLTGTSTGAIKRRTQNSLALDVRNADFFHETLRHIQQMERWSAFAQWNRDANILFSDINFRNRIKGMNTIYGTGDTLYNYMKDAFRVAIGTYRPKSDTFSEITLNAAKGVTSAKINFRTFTALKQLASFPAFFTYMTDGVFVKSYLRNWFTPHGTMKWAKETLPNFEKRISKRDMGDMRLLQRSTDWQWNKRMLDWSMKYGMAANIFFDTLTCATGARAVYDSHLADYLRKGYTQDEAEQRARQDAEQAFNTSQQSSEGAYMSPIQQDRNIITAALTVFRTSPIQYTRNFIYHTRNLVGKFRRGTKAEQIQFRTEQYVNDGLTSDQAAKAAERDYNKSIKSDIIGFVVYGALLNILWRLAGQVPYLLFGDDDDKKKQIVKDATTGGALVSPLTGLMGGGIVENALDGHGSVADMFAPEMPFTQDAKRAAQYLQNDKYAEFASQALSVLMQSSTGFDPQTAADMVMRVATTLDSEQDLDAAQEALQISQALLSIPQSQYEQMLVDRVVNDRSQYRKALEDYERYQAVHTAPLTWWVRNDEAARKAEKSAKTRFDKLLKERQELKK